MPEQNQDTSQERFVKLWMKRVEAAEGAQEKWEQRYEVARCREYWCGFQRTDPVDEVGDRKAQVNRIQPTVRAKIPSMYFYNPFVRVLASPAKADTPGQEVDDKAQLLQDTANALIRDPKCDLKQQTLLSLKESQWAFGCIETGYSADFMDNPQIEKPPLKESEDEEGAEKGPSKVIRDEWFWTRRIPPRQVLCSKPESSAVMENDWLGYWEYVNLEDVKRAPAYKNTKDLKPSGYDREKSADREREQEELQAQEVKLIKIWDLRSKRRYVFAEGHQKPLLEQDFQRLPLHFLRFEIEPDRFRPIPPIHSLLDSQDEYNDSREFLRLQRKARVARYTVDTNAIEPQEMEKFESGDPGIWIKRTGPDPDPIRPVQQPNLSDSALTTLTLSRQEFDEMSGVGAESRQVATSDTATQAAIMANKQQIQDSFDRTQVANWLASIVRELLLLAIDKMTLQRWIFINSDPYSEMFLADAQRIAQLHRQITLEELRDADNALRWDVSVDVESLSPVSEAEKQGQWMQTLNLISNPAVGPLLALSPELMKRTLDLAGIRSAKDQAAIAGALAKKMQIEAQLAQAKAGQQGGPPGVSPMPGTPGPRPIGPMGPPSGPPMNMGGPMPPEVV